jgi:hypothetical protein
MRSIDINLTDNIFNHVDGNKKHISGYKAYPINTFSKLVEEVAKLSYLNKDYLLFYRGQTKDYTYKDKYSSFFPTIYRSEYLLRDEITSKFKFLESSCKALVKLFQESKHYGYKDVVRRKLIQWSILQHYEVCDTPLLDFTQSLRVACSFAQLGAENIEKAFVYVFGLPYITNRITVNSEHEIVNIRLLSICPPNALRPYYQEGFLACTEDITDVYDRKYELDFTNRLIAKFEIPTSDDFWGTGFHKIPPESLYPKDDPMISICNQIKKSAENEMYPGDIGDFLNVWILLENSINEFVTKKTDRTYSINSSIRYLQKNKYIDSEFAGTLHKLRKIRNVIVHKPSDEHRFNLSSYIDLANNALDNWTINYLK